MRYAMRNVMTRVLPEPAPARISTGPSRWSTASRCSGFSFSRKSMGGVHYSVVGPLWLEVRTDADADSRGLAGVGIGVRDGQGLGTRDFGLRVERGPAAPMSPLTAEGADASYADALRNRHRRGRSFRDLRAWNTAMIRYDDLSSRQSSTTERSPGAQLRRAIRPVELARGHASGRAALPPACPTVGEN